LLISAGFCQTRNNHNLYTQRINNCPLELLCIDQDLEQSLLTRDFTISAFAMNYKGKVTDPTGRGFSDLKAGILSTIGDPLKRIQSDPVIAIRAIKYKMRGFDWESTLEKALCLWLPDEKTNYTHLNAAAAKELKNSDKIIFVQHLIETGLLKKMFGIAEQNVHNALLALENKINIIPESLNNQQCFFGGKSSYRDKLVNAEQVENRP
jgi:tRNA nucleotidyltransferase/poly(A) polymerase